MIYFFILYICSYPTPGKDNACEEGTVEILVRLLSDESIQVKSQSCAALMVYVLFTLDFLSLIRISRMGEIISRITDLN